MSRAALVDDVVQGPALHVLHRDVVVALVFADGIDGDDVGMIELGHGAGFAHKPFDKTGVVDKVGGQHLECDGAHEGLLVRAVHHAHAAAADFGEHFVVAEGLALKGLVAHPACPSRAEPRLLQRPECG